VNKPIRGYHQTIAWRNLNSLAFKHSF